MTGEVFAAIDLGSYEMALKIFELSDKGGVREIDHVRHRMDLGSETYATGMISNSHVDEMIRILTEFRQIMKGYGATHYKAYGTSAIRETRDITILQDLIKDILDDAEKAFTDRDEKYASMIEPKVHVVNDLINQMTQNHFSRMSSGQCSLLADAVFSTSGSGRSFTRKGISSSI